MTLVFYRSRCFCHSVLGSRFSALGSRLSALSIASVKQRGLLAQYWSHNTRMEVISTRGKREESSEVERKPLDLAKRATKIQSSKTNTYLKRFNHYMQYHINKKHLIVPFANVALELINVGSNLNVRALFVYTTCVVPWNLATKGLHTPDFHWHVGFSEYHVTCFHFHYYLRFVTQIIRLITYKIRVMHSIQS